MATKPYIASLLLRLDRCAEHPSTVARPINDQIQSIAVGALAWFEISTDETIR